MTQVRAVLVQSPLLEHNVNHVRQFTHDTQLRLYYNVGLHTAAVCIVTKLTFLLACDHHLADARDAQLPAGTSRLQLVCTVVDYSRDGRSSQSNVAEVSRHRPTPAASECLSELLHLLMQVATSHGLLYPIAPNSIYFISRMLSLQLSAAT